MNINPLTDYYKSVFSVLFRSQEFDFLCFFRFVLFFVVVLLAFSLKEASFLRDLDSLYTVSCACTGLRVLVE